MTNKGKKLRTFLLLDRAHLATVEQDKKTIIAIDATDQMLADLKEKYPNHVNLEKTYNITYGCYTDCNNKRLRTIIFLSPILAEIIKLSENLLGNNFEVVEARPEILSTLSFLFSSPSESEMGVSLGILKKNNKTLRHLNGSLVLNNNTPLTYTELQEYMRTANLPESYLQRLEAQGSRNVIYNYTQGERRNLSPEDINVISEKLLGEIISNSVQQESLADGDSMNPC